MQATQATPMQARSDDGPARPLVVAHYFPQLHAIPENDAWWGEGFTDWVNVRRARPLFPGHHQPRVPAGGCYDQSQESVIRHQVELARAHGVDAFCHYHYWFDGKQLLQRPTEIFLSARDLDLRFCLWWANETWSRRWDGQDHEVLQLQTHPPRRERWDLHFDHLLRAFRDERYLRVRGRPLFILYRPERIEALGDMLDHYRERAHRAGLGGLYLACVHQHEAPAQRRLFDAMVLFQPFTSMAAAPHKDDHRPRWYRALRGAGRHLPAPAWTWALERLSRPTLLDYDEVWRQILSLRADFGVPALKGAFVDWDNTARYRNRATILRGASPERFEFWLRRLFGAASEDPEEERLIFLNAWNEWAEGAYLEPDERHGLAYLEALRRVVRGEPAPRLTGARP